MRWHAVLFGLSLLALGAGCGGAPPPTPKEAPAPPGQPPAPGHAPITELDALEHDLDVASDRLVAGLERKQRELTLQKDQDETAKESEKTEATKSADKKKPATERPQPRDREEADGAEGEAAPGRGGGTRTTGETSIGVGSPCDVACRALASMKRSADKICELAGEQSERCTRARAKLVDADTRVKSAGCACRQGDQVPPPQNDASNREPFQRVCELRPTTR